MTKEELRNKILKVLKEKFDALSAEKICEIANITEKEDIDEAKYFLNDLVRQKTVRKTKNGNYLLFSHCNNFKTGKIVVKKQGYGFLDLKDKDGNQLFNKDGSKLSVHIAPGKLNYALDGDEVCVEITEVQELPKETKMEGKVIEVLKRGDTNIVGTIVNNGKELVFEPFEKKDRVLLIDKESIESCVEGEVVVVSVLNNIEKNIFTATVAKRIGHKDDPHMDIIEIAAKHDIFVEFPEEAMEQAEELPNTVDNEYQLDRTDLRDEMIYTIDGKDTKDIDDAIGVYFKDGYYILKVCIADVSHYVTEGSPLDEEAYARGTSSYLADTVIPMLPHKLSNGICSLNEGVDRFAVTCEMKIDSRGTVVESKVYKSIIKSKKKMNYDDVNSILEDGIVPEGYEEFADNLLLMNELAHIIRDERNRRGASNFDTEEAKVKCDEDGKALDIVKRVQRSGEKLIEDMMVAANESVARLLSDRNLPCVYRVHDMPKKDKVEKFVSFCNNSGQRIKGKVKDEITPREYSRILSQIQADPDMMKIYNRLAIRSMPRAEYSDENYGHFGLASEFYAHFTSPIRRYPDLLVHRMLTMFIINKINNENIIKKYKDALHEKAKQCSEREQKATEAEREVNDMKFAEYMMDHIGEEYSGVITNTTEFGFWVELDNLIEGFVDIRSINGDFYDYNSEAMMFVGRNTKQSFRVGQRIDVKVVNADKDQQIVDFEIARNLKKQTEEERGPVRKRTL